MYNLIISLFDNILVKAIQNYIKRKLNIDENTKNNINDEVIEDIQHNDDTDNISVENNEIITKDNKDHTINLVIQVKQ